MSFPGKPQLTAFWVVEIPDWTACLWHGVCDADMTPWRYHGLGGSISRPNLELNGVVRQVLFAFMRSCHCRKLSIYTKLAWTCWLTYHAKTAAPLVYALFGLASVRQAATTANWAIIATAVWFASFEWFIGFLSAEPLQLSGPTGH